MKIPWLVLPVAVCAAFGVFGAEPRLPEQPRPESGLSPEGLAQRTGCLDCHSVDKKKVGPAYRDVAARYRNHADARATLARKIKTGGKGNWTDITGGKGMPPHSALLSEAEISQLVGWILSR